jgi:hypothetical protein
MIESIAEVTQAAVARPAIDDSASTIQFYLIVIQVLWGLVLLLLGIVIAYLTRTLREFQGKLSESQDKHLELYKLILTEYSTKTDLSKRVHGLRDALGVHSTWIHLLAHGIKMDLPSSNNRRHNDGSED